MIKVLIADGIDPEGLSMLASNSMFNLIYVKDAAQLEKEIPDADALLVRSKTKVNSNLLELCKKLKFVGRAGVGVDNIDVPAASKKGIVVVNAPGGNTISAAEHTVALMLTLSRNVSQADKSLRTGLWERNKFVGTELQGKILGLVGFGRIGSEVAKRAMSFEMKVIAYDPFVSEEHMKSFGVQPESFENVLKKADYISLHMPANEQTKKIINEDAISKMKPDARLINCARGSLIDEVALLNALKSKKIKGAALDVYSAEPPTFKELFEIENAVFTPHLGASTEEAQSKVAIDVAISLKEYFEKGMIRNAVNMPSVDPEMLQKISPYLNLSEKLGRFLSQITEGGIQEIKTEFLGDFSSAMMNLLSLSVVKGVFSTALEEKEVNWVNALPFAKERGVRIEHSSVSGAADFTTLISVQIKTDRQIRSVSGTIFSRGKAKIVEIDDLSVDVSPEGHLLVLTNADQPGVVGFVGTVLGEKKINIAQFQVGRKSAGGEAVSILNVDSPIPEDVIKKIRDFRSIKNIWVVNLTDPNG